MSRVTSATNSTTAEPPSGTTYFCGIDVAKHKHVALILDIAEQRVKPAFNVLNSRTDSDGLLEQLGALPGYVKVALEPTGHYWLALFETLTTASYEVVVFNPLQVHAYQRSGIRKCKNDRSDAFSIADFLRISEPQLTPQTWPTLLRLGESETVNGEASVCWIVSFLNMRRCLRTSSSLPHSVCCRKR